VTDLLVVTGFADQPSVDAFVRCEIRYFRSRDMRLRRVAGPDGGPALLLEFGDRPDLSALAAALAAAHPGLGLLWAREEQGRPAARAFGTRPPAATAGTLHDLAARYQVLEEIYGTF
jgi:hypothetical protein